MAEDVFDLQRFVDAQDFVYERVKTELSRGHKTSHWIWFIFPQLYGLGSSARSQKYGIRSREEAAAYLAHPVLGPRLRECTALVVACKGATIDTILPPPDDVKFQSSMTLFEAVSDESDESLFREALEQFFGGVRDAATLSMLTG